MSRREIARSLVAGVWETGVVEENGGSPAVTARELLSGSGVAIASQGGELLTWSKDSGDTLLDLSDTNQPTVITEGVYAVSVTVRHTGAMTTGKVFVARLSLDASGDTSLAAGVATANDFAQAEVPLCIVSHLPADAEIQLFVQNFDTDFVQFGIHYATVQQLS